MMQKGVTLYIADEKNIKWLAVEKDTFYFTEGWLELVGGNNMFKMAKKKMLDITNREKTEQYLKENKIDFYKGDDVKKLYAFLPELL